MLTPWFPAGTHPVRDGLYMTRGLIGNSALAGWAECWHVMRWHGATWSWYGAGTSGAEREDLIGGDRHNFLRYQWRGCFGSAA